MSQIIRERLAVLKPLSLVIEDDSAAHQGHHHLSEDGLGESPGHYHITIVSALFNGKSAVERHRMVYQALSGLIGPKIHAVQIVAKTETEV